MACWYLLQYYFVFLPLFLSVLTGASNIGGNLDSNETFAFSVYLVLGLLSILVVILELRGTDQPYLKELVLLSLFRSALRLYNFEGTEPE